MRGPIRTPIAALDRLAAASGTLGKIAITVA
ncbi:hypothetical protein J2S43_002364 [Catenuloplanes nepalensis]|uniref:Uncharacterized protein n=1 Tax=Catenuloplanes nepalensis TaxID=587533 RepID=A0ABT9MQZ4_9ACTN|nr:hypothetical protein [Catenuloplanes nepalensis]